MSPTAANPPTADWQARLDRFARQRPDAPLMAPYLAYLLLLTLQYALPYEWRPLAAAVRGVGALLVVWAFRRHLPPLGKLHLGWAVLFGVIAAALWVGGQKAFNELGLPIGLPPLFAAQPEIVNPHHELATAWQFWLEVVSKIAVAVIAVPVVEELFWRGFLLRALINWSEPEKVPLGAFTWFSFVGTALLSTLQHPYNWTISIFCWLLFNGLFYWKKSLLFLMIVHGVTNLALYIHVVYAGDWAFW